MTFISWFYEYLFRHNPDNTDLIPWELSLCSHGHLEYTANAKILHVAKSKLWHFADGFLDKQSNKEWAQLDNRKLPELERLTICVWVKLHFHRIHNQVWSYCALKNFILVCSGLGKPKL